MSNDKNNIMSDDEYQFPKDEYLHQSAEVTANAASHSDDSISDEKIVKRVGMKQIIERFPVLKNKKFYFITAFVLVIFVGINMMHHGEKPVVSKPTVTTQEQPAIQTQDANSQIANQLDSIKSDQVSNQDTLSQVKQTISSLNSKLNATQTANEQLAQSVTMLTSQLRLLTRDVQKNTQLLASTTKKPVKKGAPIHRPKPITYDVKAIVPGRAWIVASTGNSYSVTVGDSIDQYGTVKAIDPDTGRVYTSSGKVIAYGPNDY